MSWKSGADLFGDMIEMIMGIDCDFDEKVTAFTTLISCFEAKDYDSTYEWVGTHDEYDYAWESLYPKQYAEYIKDNELGYGEEE